MNWQTEEILKQAKDIVNDETVFSEDQIALLQNLIDKIGEAIGKESRCVSSGINYNM